MSQIMPLRYRISSLRQLPCCLSNNSHSLKIHVSDFTNNDLLEGFRITVEHPTMGILFACLLDAKGTFITGLDKKSPSHEFTIDQILAELRKFGFLIEYRPALNLSGDQIQYLMTLNKLGFDKIRILNVWKTVREEKSFTWYVVAFRACPHGDWLNDGYSPSQKEFQAALMNGTAMNLTDVSKTRQFRWDWLDYVANIDDLIRVNADDGVWETPPETV